MTTYLKRRTVRGQLTSYFYAQMAVPLDLQSVLGCKTFDQSLRTTNAAEAKARLPAVIGEWRDLITRTRANTLDAKAKLRELTAGQMARRDYEARLRLDASLRADVRGYASLGVDDLRVRELRDALSGRLDDHGLREVVGPALDRFARSGFVIADFGSPAWREQAKALAASEYEAMGRIVERDEGDFGGKPTQPVLVNAEPEPEAPKEGEGILKLFDKYAAENAKGISTDTLTQARREVKLFADNVGNPPAHKITKRHVRQWKDLLLAYPVKAAESAVFKGMSMAAIVEKNKEVGKPTISDGTINRYLSAVGAFSDWLVRNEILDRNPTEGMFQHIDKTARQKAVFTVEQMNTLFGSSLYTGAKSAKEWMSPGKVEIRDHRYWVPLVMLFAGARPAEIAQLLVSDVRELHGRPIIHITETGDDDKSVKTKGSMRVVPIHPELVKLGFLEYRDRMQVAGAKRLFPNAERNSRGQMLADFSRDFGRFLGKIGVKEGKGLSLYSFRHGAIDALRRAGFLDAEIAFLAGHTSHTMTGQYGHLPQGTLEQRAKMVEAIGYPGLNLEHLHVQRPDDQRSAVVASGSAEH